MKSDLVRVRHALDACRNVTKFAGGLDAAQLRQDEKAAHAALFDLAVLGEALGKVSPSFRTAHPAIPWKEIVGMRNRLTHGYDEVDYGQVAIAVNHSVPRLAHELSAILDSAMG